MQSTLSKFISADQVSGSFELAEITAVEAEMKLIDLGFHNVTFPRRGPLVTARLLSVPYEYWSLSCKK